VNSGAFGNAGGLPDERPIYDQELALGCGAAGWDGPAVTGGRRAVGSVLVVDPHYARHPVDRAAFPAVPETAILPLSGPAVVVTALAQDGLSLRRQLDTGVAAIAVSMQGACS